MVDWIGIDKTSGSSGTTKITITASSYTELTARTTSLTVTGKQQPITGTVSITQQPEEVTTGLTVTPTELVFDSTGETLYITITSNAAWTWGVWPDWVGVQDAYLTGGKAGTTTVSIGAVKNSGTTELTGILSVKTYNETVQINCTQKAYTPPQIMESQTDSLDFTSGGGTNVFDVYSNGAWTVVSYPDWLTLSATGGTGVSRPTGKEYVTVTCGENTGDTRIGSIVLKASDENGATKTIYVTQEKALIPTLEVSTDTITFKPIVGETSSFTITCNVDWCIVEYPDWVNVTPIVGSGNTTVTVETLNTSYENRIEAIVVKENKSGATKVVSVFQTRLIELVVEPEENEIYSLKSSDGFNVKSSSDWEISNIEYSVGAYDGFEEISTCVTDAFISKPKSNWYVNGIKNYKYEVSGYTKLTCTDTNDYFDDISGYTEKLITRGGVTSGYYKNIKEVIVPSSVTYVRLDDSETVYLPSSVKMVAGDVNLAIFEDTNLDSDVKYLSGKTVFFKNLNTTDDFIEKFRYRFNFAVVGDLGVDFLTQKIYSLSDWEVTDISDGLEISPTSGHSGETSFIAEGSWWQSFTIKNSGTTLKYDFLIPDWEIMDEYLSELPNGLYYLGENVDDVHYKGKTFISYEEYETEITDYRIVLSSESSIYSNLVETYGSFNSKKRHILGYNHILIDKGQDYIDLYNLNNTLLFITDTYKYTEFSTKSFTKNNSVVRTSDLVAKDYSKIDIVPLQKQKQIPYLGFLKENRIVRIKYSADTSFQLMNPDSEYCISNIGKTITYSFDGDFSSVQSTTFTNEFSTSASTVYIEFPFDTTNLDNAFANNENIVGGYILKDGVSTNGTFAGCHRMQYAYTTSLGENEFSECYLLIALIIDADTEIIPYYNSAFPKRYSYDRTLCISSGVLDINSDNNLSNCFSAIYIPEAKLSKYEIKDGWDSISSITKTYKPF